MNLPPHTLSNRLLILFITLILFAQLITAFLFQHIQETNHHRSRMQQTIGQVASLLKVLQQRDSKEWPSIIQAQQTPIVHLELAPNASAAEKQPHPMAANIRERLARLTTLPIIISIEISTPLWLQWDQWDRSALLSNIDQVDFSLQLSNRQWINVQVDMQNSSPFRFAPIQWIQLIFLLLMIIAVYFMIRKLMRPLRNLTKAADYFCQTKKRLILPEEGTREIRRTTRAFNMMQRLAQRSIKRQKQLTTSLSNDLQTPLTRIKIRLETLDDPVIKNAINNHISELEKIISDNLRTQVSSRANDHHKSVLKGDQ